MKKKITLESIFGNKVAKDIRKIDESIYNTERSRAFLEAASQIIGEQRAKSVLEAQAVLLEELQHVTYHNGRNWQQRTGNKPQGAFPQSFGYNQRAIDRSTYGNNPGYVRTMHDHDYGTRGQWGPPPAEPTRGYRMQPPPPPTPQYVEAPAPRAVRQPGVVRINEPLPVNQTDLDNVATQMAVDTWGGAPKKTPATPGTPTIKEQRQAKVKADAEAERKKAEEVQKTRLANEERIAKEKAEWDKKHYPEEPVSGNKEKTKPATKTVKSGTKTKTVKSSKVDYEKDFMPATGKGCPEGFPYTIHISSFNSDHKDGAEKRARLLADKGIQGVYFYQLDGQGKNSKRVNVWRVRVGYFRTKDAAAKYAKEEIEPITGLKRFVQSDRTKAEGQKGWWIDTCSNDKYVQNSMFALNIPDIHADGVNPETAKATLVCPDGSAPVAQANGAQATVPQANAPVANQGTPTATPASPAQVATATAQQEVPGMSDAEVDTEAEVLMAGNREAQKKAAVEGNQEFNGILPQLIKANLFTADYYNSNKIESSMSHLAALDENKFYETFSIADDDQTAVSKMKKYFIKMYYKFAKFNAFCDLMHSCMPAKAWEEFYDTIGMSSLEVHTIIADMADEIDDAYEHFYDYTHGKAQGVVDDADDDFYQCIEQFSEEIDNAWQALNEVYVDELSAKDVDDAVQQLKKTLKTKYPAVENIKTGEEARDFLRMLMLNEFEMWPFYKGGDITSHKTAPFSGSNLYINSSATAPDKVRLHDDNMKYISTGTSSLMSEQDRKNLEANMAAHNANLSAEEMQSEANKFIVKHATDLNKTLSALLQYIDKQSFDEVNNDETENTKKYVDALLAENDDTKKLFAEFIASIEDAMEKHKKSYTKKVVTANGWKVLVSVMNKVKERIVGEMSNMVKADKFNSVNFIIKMKELAHYLKQIDDIKKNDKYRVKSEAELKAEKEKKEKEAKKAEESKPENQPDEPETPKEETPKAEEPKKEQVPQGSF